MTPTDETLRRSLAEARTIAVFGMSANPLRPSFGVARSLQAAGYRILPVNPGIAGRTLLGETVWPDLASIPAEVGPVEMVDIFRRSDRAGEAVDAALAHLLDRGLRTIWMQIGVVDAAAAARAEASGVTVVMDRCTRIEHRRLLGA